MIDYIETLNLWKEKNKMEQIEYSKIDMIHPFVPTLKIDGQLVGIYFKNGDIKIFSRKGLEVMNIPAIDELLKVLSKYKEAFLIGEIYGVDENDKILPFNQTISLLRNIDQTNAKRIRIYLLDILYLDDYVPLSKRESITTLNNLFKNLNFVYPIKVVDDVKKAWENEVLNGEFEGLVLWYDDGRIFKVKPILSFDLVVIFIEISEKHKDMMGALGLAFIDEDNNFRFAGKVGTGFTQKERREWLSRAFDNKVKQIKNTIWIKPKFVVEVEAMGIFIRKAECYDKEYNLIGMRKSGILRQPKFKMIREDKNPDKVDVRLSQIKNFEENKADSDTLFLKSLPWS